MPRRFRSIAVPVAIAVLVAFAASETEAQAAPARGIITGVVVDTAGRPFRGASVVLDSGAPRVTVGDGRFAFANVPLGTHAVEVFAIGMRPQLTSVEVVAGRPAELTIRFEPLTTLPAVRVIASHWQRRMIDELPARMAKGHGQFRDSTVLANRMSWEGAIAGMRRGLRVRYAGRSTTIDVLLLGTGRRPCTATIYIDGYVVEASRLHMYSPQDIAMMEVYDLPELVPFNFGSGCGVVALWTKDAIEGPPR
jgi:hypothetical protein